MTKIQQATAAIEEISAGNIVIGIEGRSVYAYQGLCGMYVPADSAKRVVPLRFVRTPCFRATRDARRFRDELVALAEQGATMAEIRRAIRRARRAIRRAR